MASKVKKQKKSKDSKNVSVEVKVAKQRKWGRMTKEARDYTIKSMQQVMPVVLGRSTNNYARREILTQIQGITSHVKEDSKGWRVLDHPVRKVLLDSRESHHKINVANKALEKKLAFESSQTRALQAKLAEDMARAEEVQESIKDYEGRIAALERVREEVTPTTISKVQVEWNDDPKSIAAQITVGKEQRVIVNVQTEAASTECQQLISRLRNAFVGAATEMRNSNETLRPWIERLSAVSETLPRHVQQENA